MRKPSRTNKRGGSSLSKRIGNSTLLTIRVKPRAKQPSIKETKDGGLLIAVHEAPADGQANTAVVKAIAKHFDVPRSSVRIIRGLTSRNKVVRIEGLVG